MFSLWVQKKHGGAAHRRLDPAEGLTPLQKKLKINYPKYKKNTSFNLSLAMGDNVVYVIITSFEFQTRIKNKFVRFFVRVCGIIFLGGQMCKFLLKTRTHNKKHIFLNKNRKKNRKTIKLFLYDFSKLTGGWTRTPDIRCVR